MADGLSRVRRPEAIAHICQRVVSAALLARCEIWLPDRQGELQAPAQSMMHTVPDAAIVKWSFDKGQVAGAGTDTLPGVPYKILPLTSSGRTLGLLIIEPSNVRHLMIPEQQRLLETFLVLIAGAAEREELRNSLLAALSHDLRTPLTVLFGQAEILMLNLSSEGSRYVHQADELRPQTDWIALEEIIGSALKSLEGVVSARHVRLDLPREMILLRADGPLLERVFVNLLENAQKYAGQGAEIGIRAEKRTDTLKITVWDNGPGLPAGNENQLFDKFTRGHQESAIPGVGMGLAICRAIVEMHQGEIYAANRPSGGACFTIILPLPPAPALEEPLQEDA